MQGPVPAGKRAEWRSWAEQEFRGDERAIDAATDAVLGALIDGENVEEAMAVGRTAAASSALEGSDYATDSQRSHPVSDADHLRGRVASFRQRAELMGNRYGSVWDFRVDSWDAAGVPQAPVAVEMRGVVFTGSVGDGDWVEIASRWKAGEVLGVRSLQNLSMNARVEVGEDGARKHPIRGLFKAVFLLLVLALFVIVVNVLLFGPGQLR
jgi:hypothetical protein